jgi:hypothetical protein
MALLSLSDMHFGAAGMRTILIKNRVRMHRIRPPSDHSAGKIQAELAHRRRLANFVGADFYELKIQVLTITYYEL